MTTKQIAAETIQRRTFLGGLIAGCGYLFGLSRLRTTTGRPDLSKSYHHSTELGTEDVFNEWPSRSRMPIWFSHVPQLSLLIEAIRRNEPLYGPYHRWGDQTLRRVTPLALFHVEPEIEDFDYPKGAYPDVIDVGPVYLQAWDHDRQAGRTFLAEYFHPYLTAPWMQIYAPEKEKQNWQATLDAAVRELRRRGIPPIHSQLA